MLHFQKHTTSVICFWKNNIFPTFPIEYGRTNQSCPFWMLAISLAQAPIQAILHAFNVSCHPGGYFLVRSNQVQNAFGDTLCFGVSYRQYFVSPLDRGSVSNLRTVFPKSIDSPGVEYSTVISSHRTRAFAFGSLRSASPVRDSGVCPYSRTASRKTYFRIPYP